MVIYGEAIWDPVTLTGRMGGVGVILALFALLLATSPPTSPPTWSRRRTASPTSAPRRISFKMGGYITAGIGIVMFPWKLLETTGAYIFTWLIGYSALLGPIAGIMLADYFLIRRTELDSEELFKARRPLQLPRRLQPGRVRRADPRRAAEPARIPAGGRFRRLVPAVFDAIYAYAWFVGLIVAGGVYLMFSKRA